MKLKSTVIVPLAMCLFLVGPADARDEHTIIGKVIKVIDGDSIHLLDTYNVTHKVRLAAIDAPETRRFNGAAQPQPFSMASKKALAHIVAANDVTALCHKKDTALGVSA